MSNWFTRYKGPGGGTGMGSWDRAINDGYSPQQIAAAVGGSGLSVGWRLRDAANAVNAGAAAQRQAQQQVQQQANQYESQISGYKSQLADYQNQVSTLNSQYQGALAQGAEYQKQASDWQEQFKVKSADYDRANEEADRYRNEAVGQQLRSIRAGSTTSNRQPVIGAESDLSSGSKRFAGGQSETDLTSMIKSEGGLTDSVLARKGPVVERIGGRPQSSGLASGSGSGSYYASRFS